jgi:hypothetical protein
LILQVYDEHYYKQRDYHNYCGEDEAALRKRINQEFEAFQSSELWKAFLLPKFTGIKAILTEVTFVLIIHDSVLEQLSRIN